MLYNLYNVTNTFYVAPCNKKPLPLSKIYQVFNDCKWLYKHEHKTNILNEYITRRDYFHDATIETIERTVKYADGSMELYTIEFVGYADEK